MYSVRTFAYLRTIGSRARNIRTDSSSDNHLLRSTARMFESMYSSTMMAFCVASPAVSNAVVAASSLAENYLSRVTQIASVNSVAHTGWNRGYLVFIRY